MDKERFDQLYNRILNGDNWNCADLDELIYLAETGLREEGRINRNYYYCYAVDEKKLKKDELEFGKQRHAAIGDLFFYEGKFNIEFMYGLWRLATVVELSVGNLKTTDYYWENDDAKQIRNE